MARFRELERPALFRPEDFRPLERDDLRALLRAVPRLPRLADLPDFLADRRVLFLAGRRALFLAPFRADFRPLLPPDRFADFLRDPPPLRDRLVPPVLLLGAGSSKSKEDEDEDDDPGEEGEGVLSEGRGSIQPEPDQPISI